MSLPEAAQVFLEALKNVDFTYDYYPETECMTVLSFYRDKRVISFKNLFKHSGKIHSITINRASMIIVTYETGEIVELHRNSYEKIVCLDGKELTLHAETSKNVLVSKGKVYTYQCPITYSKEGIYYDRHFNRIQLEPLEFVKPADYNAFSEIYNSDILYMVKGITIINNIYTIMPPWVRIRDPLYSVRTEDGKKYMLIKYINENNRSSFCLTNSKKCFTFTYIPLYDPKAGPVLEILNTSKPPPDCKIFRVNDVFLEEIIDSYGYHTFKERTAVNPQCGKFTKPAASSTSNE